MALTISPDKEDLVEQFDHTPMWRALGLDLDAHSQLLEILGTAYKDVFLSQQNRPKAMAYLDFVMSEIHGLRIRELVAAKEKGRKVVGTFCLYVPEEVLLAVDAISVGLCAGAELGTQAAEQILPRNTCALIKSFVGFKLAKVCPYVEACDVVIGETTCDGKTKAYESFARLKDMFVLQVPRMKSPESSTLWRSEVRRLANRMEEISGRSITSESLLEAIKTVNAKRRALHRLNALRRADPAPVSGLDALLVNQVQFYDDPVRLTQKIDELCDELEGRVARHECVKPSGAPRLVVSGCPMSAPNWKLHNLIEKSGGVVVGEESCVGERGTRNLVSEEPGSKGDLLDRIADRYLKIDCAIFTPNDERAEHVLDLVRDTKAQGVVHYALQFCTPYQMEAFKLAQACEKRKIPFLRIETDYGAEDAGQLSTRVQAFLEMVR